MGLVGALDGLIESGDEMGCEGGLGGSELGVGRVLIGNWPGTLRRSLLVVAGAVAQKRVWLQGGCVVRGLQVFRLGRALNAGRGLELACCVSLRLAASRLEKTEAADW